MEHNEPKTVAVGQHTYIIDKFLADRGLKVFVRIAKIVAEPLARATALKDEELGSAAFAEITSSMVSALVERMDEDEVIRTVHDLLTVVMVEGQGSQTLASATNPNQGPWKVHFKGKLGEMMEVLNHVIMENFEDFLSVLKSAVAKQTALRAKAKAKSPGPTT